MPHVFPAHAGMIPVQAKIVHERLRVPRTRGDDPTRKHIKARLDECSPHTRG